MVALDPFVLKPLVDLLSGLYPDDPLAESRANQLACTLLCDLLNNDVCEDTMDPLNELDQTTLEDVFDTLSDICVWFEHNGYLQDYGMFDIDLPRHDVLILIRRK